MLSSEQQNTTYGYKCQLQIPKKRECNFERGNDWWQCKCTISSCAISPFYGLASLALPFFCYSLLSDSLECTF